MQHAKSYFENTKYFIEMYKSDLVKYRYELDAYNIEANFINFYLLKKSYTLTLYACNFEYGSNHCDAPHWQHRQHAGQEHHSLAVGRNQRAPGQGSHPGCDRSGDYGHRNR